MQILLKLIMTPFIILGVVNFLRGAFAIIEEDSTKFDWKNDWKLTAYIIITFAGYFAMFLAVALWIK